MLMLKGSHWGKILQRLTLGARWHRSTGLRLHSEERSTHRLGRSAVYLQLISRGNNFLWLQMSDAGFSVSSNRLVREREGFLGYTLLWSHGRNT